MRRLIVIALIAFSNSVFADDDFDRWYVKGEVATILPQGGSRIRHGVGAGARFGAYIGELWSIEGEAVWLQKSTGLGANLLWHWWGYERVDPFFTVGARCLIGDDVNQSGPKAGLGTYVHLTEHCSLRIDADVMLGVDSDAEALYSISLGAQIFF